MYSKRICSVVAYRFKRVFSEPRVYGVLVIVLILALQANGTVQQICANYGVKASVLPQFVSLANTRYYQLVLMVLIVVLFCDAPFYDETQPYVLLRSGRGEWVNGQMIAIILMSALFWLWVFVASVLSIANCVTWEWDWGRVFYSIPRNEALEKTLKYGFDPYYSAAEAFALSLALKTLLSTAFGMIAFLINLGTRRNFGLLGPIALTLLYFRATSSNIAPRWIFFSPMSLADLSALSVSGRADLPTPAYAFLFLGVFVAVLWCMCAWVMRNQSIDVKHRT